jgi:hypothetical protein
LLILPEEIQARQKKSWVDSGSAAGQVNDIGPVGAKAVGFLMVTLALLFKPSTTPLEISF